jgi:hypothetical protein
MARGSWVWAVILLSTLTGFSCVNDIVVIAPSEEDPCQEFTCQNDGVCSLGDEGEPRCDCLPGFEGELCQTSAASCDPDPCQNDGR